MAFWGATVFIAAVGPCRVMNLEKKRKKKEKKFQLKKRQRFQKNHRRGHRTRARARINITPQTYGTEEVCVLLVALGTDILDPTAGRPAEVPCIL